MVSPIDDLHAIGQSLWYDNIHRNKLVNGELAAMISRGEIRGITSNPSIFNQAISISGDYDEELTNLAKAGLDTEQIYDQLVTKDICAATELFGPLFQESRGGDGYVSLEVNPNLAHDTEATIKEARRLWNLVNRPNLMVKIPATQEGLPAITQCISAGININVTLIFSLKRYADVIAAFLYGLEYRQRAGEPIDGIASVASFFVSRIDTKVDKKLQEIIKRGGIEAKLADGILGEAAIASTKIAYGQYLEVFEGKTFAEIKEHGGRAQRPLWASTSTKNPVYSDVKYVEGLIGPNTINTVPEHTLEAFKEHGQARLTLTENLTDAQSALQALEELGISMEQVTQELEDEGVKAFADSYNALLATIETRRESARRQ
ncbi:MAG TPA: transaldolase [Anaerolineales bacterium]|nr:transaldolase [Anaerolineales bacterium]